MNAQKIYDSLILKRRTDVLSRAIAGVERHHVIPRSWGGNNNPVNLVFLTRREHFFAHLLLIKLARSTEEKLKMLYSIKRMNPWDKSSRAYERIQERWQHEQLSFMSEVVGKNGETRRELTTQKSARTMATTIINGKTLLEHRLGKRSVYNSEVYKWEHVDGRTFIGTAFELSRAHRVELIEPRKMMERFNTPVRHRGWRSEVGAKIRTKLESKYSEVYTWKHKNGLTFEGTCYELSKMHPKGLYPNKLHRVTKKGGNFGGWKIGASK